jgi:polysaccharide biosynthesis transport protein
MRSNDLQLSGLDQDQPESTLSIQELFRLVLDNLWIVLVILAASAAVAYYQIKTTPVTYKSRAVLLAEFKDVQLMEFKQFEGNEGYRTAELLNTVASGVSRLGVLLRVADSIKGDPELAAWATNQLTTNDIASILRGRISARVRRQTRFIDVETYDGNPKYARRLAQRVVEEYLAFELANRQGTGSGATNFLNAEADRLRARLDESELNLTRFQRTNNISMNETDDLVSSDLKSLNTQLMETKGDRLRLEADLAQIQGMAGDIQKLLAIPSILEAVQVAELRTKILEVDNELENLKQRYKAKHPKMIEAVNLGISLRDKLNLEVGRAPQFVELEYKKAKLKEAQLEIAVVEHGKELGELNVLRMDFNRLKKSADYDRELYEGAMKRSREADINMSILQRKDAKANISIFENADFSGIPIAPNKRKIALVALMIGMGLSLGIIYLLHALDNTVKSVDQAERLFGLPVLGSIPRSPEIRGDKERLILAADPNSLCSESFRTLRAAISLLGREGERKVVLFTSAVPSEGKTFCSSNFALASSKQGKKTLIVDFDLRRPSVGDTFGLASDKIGVSDCLLGKAGIEEAATVTEYENLHVMPAGTMVPNPSELISSLHTKEFIEEACQKYDQVVIDNAPVTAVSDTLLILNYVDTVCLVSRAGKTSYRLIERAMELIRRGGTVPSGLVLNFVPEKGRSGYYYYYNSDKSYYGGYGQSSTKKTETAKS